MDIHGRHNLPVALPNAPSAARPQVAPNSLQPHGPAKGPSVKGV